MYPDDKIIFVMEEIEIKIILEMSVKDIEFKFSVGGDKNEFLKLDFKISI